MQDIFLLTLKFLLDHLVINLREARKLQSPCSLLYFRMEISNGLFCRRLVLIDKDDPSWFLFLFLLCSLLLLLCCFSRTCGDYNLLRLIAIAYFLFFFFGFSSRVTHCVLGGLDHTFHFLGKKALHLLN